MIKELLIQLAAGHSSVSYQSASASACTAVVVNLGLLTSFCVTKSSTSDQSTEGPQRWYVLLQQLITIV